MTDASRERRPRRTKAEQRAESIEQILDAAEYLFSRNGLYGVTLVHYYFQDKKALFEAVFARRAGTTSDRRMAALAYYEAKAGDEPTVEGALHAFLDTDLDLYYEGGPKWMNYASFCARVSNTPEGAELMDVYMRVLPPLARPGRPADMSFIFASIPCDIGRRASFCPPG